MKKETTLLNFEIDTELGKLFRDISGERIYVKSYEDGCLVINAGIGSTIHSVANLVEGCFEENSNVSIVMSMVYGTDTELQQISFEFNGAVIKADFNTTSENMVKQLYDHYDKEQTRRDAEYEEYKKTPQYDIDMAEKARKDAERKAIEKEVIRIDELTFIEFMNDEAKVKWGEFIAANKDGYGSGIIQYARRWAKYMQSKIHKGERLVDIAETTSRAADIDGITGFMYGYAVNVLSQTWKYGDELRRWHNKDYGYSGDGCVSPAVLSIG